MGDRGSGQIEFAFPHVDREPVDHLARARTLLADEDRAGAMLELEKALYDNPTDHQAASLLGKTARQAGRIELAVDSFMLATQIEPDGDEPWLELARLSLASGGLEQAEQLVGRAIRLNPQRALGHNLLGRIWLSRSHWERAIECFSKALQRSPQNAYYRNNLGFALLLRRDFDRAIQVLEPLATHPDLPAFMYNNLGLAYEGAGKLQESIALFKRALDRNPRYVNAQVNLDRMVQVAQRSEPPATGQAGEEVVQGLPESPDLADEDLILPEEETP